MQRVEPIAFVMPGRQLEQNTDCGSRPGAHDELYRHSARSQPKPATWKDDGALGSKSSAPSGVRSAENELCCVDSRNRTCQPRKARTSSPPLHSAPSSTSLLH